MGSQYPKTIQAAVEILLFELSDRDKETIRSMTEEQLPTLHLTLGDHIRKSFGLGRSNRELLMACCPDSNRRNADEASMAIIKALWCKLQPVQ